MGIEADENIFFSVNVVEDMDNEGFYIAQVGGGGLAAHYATARCPQRAAAYALQKLVDFLIKDSVEKKGGWT